MIVEAREIDAVFAQAARVISDEWVLAEYVKTPYGGGITFLAEAEHAQVIMPTSPPKGDRQ